MEVKNLNGTTGLTAPNGKPWLKYYIEEAGLKYIPFCCVLGCCKTAQVGAHVKKVHSSDNCWYIVPMCYKHNNQRDEPLELSSGTKLVRSSD